MLHLKVPVGEGVQNGFAVFERHHARVFVQVFDENPLTDPTVWLNLAPERVLKSQFAPFAFDVWSFSQDLLFKVARGFYLWRIIPERYGFGVEVGTGPKTCTSTSER
jgi:hypothetical protein